MMHKLINPLLNQVRNFLIFHIRYPWITIGKNMHCQWSTRFWSPHRLISIGNNVGIGKYCLFMTDAEIGNDVLIASNVAFLNRDEHSFDKVGINILNTPQEYKHKVTVNDDVWIGHGAILLSPLTINRGAIIAAGSVVVKDVPSYAIIGGNPARILKMRFTQKQIIEHERILSMLCKERED